MDARMDSQAAKRNDDFRTYDALFQTRIVANNATHLLPHIKPGSRILDVGCGIGSITMDFARRAPDGFVLGIDSSASSIYKATSDAKALGITNVGFQVCSAEDMSRFNDEGFDIAHAHQVLLHLPDPVGTLKEMRRLVRPGGIVASRDAIYIAIYPVDPTMQKYIDNSWEMHWNRTGKAEGGLVNHVWMHDAGFEWNTIERGCATWEWSNSEQRRASADAVIASAKKGHDAEFVEELSREMKAWAEKPEAKKAALDGWVLGKKE